ncbi:OsmC family protein [Sandaracinus amylolyticus]|uniref:OsmC family protein n=1 Tax=Sandaracinus amylolyticus TaxID=927083 RepID=UPI001F1A160A|nr:OsmC family protein [Sandaracinus amylolyticus]UJR84074.1 Hypothetical protein I5071_61450 [Sandaracinus amylolyticus]
MTIQTAVQTHTTSSPRINGFDLAALQQIVEHVGGDPSAALAGFRVTSRWKGQARVESSVEGYELGGQNIARRHVIRSDEPRELFGEDSGPNPQELLFAALNACLIFGYACNAAAMGIAIDELSIETRGTIDLRGPLGLTQEVPPGCPAIRYVVRIRAAGATKAQLEELHATVMQRSPNHYHLASAIPLVSQLVID